MSRSLVKLAVLAVLALGAWVGMYCYERQKVNPVRRAEDARAAAAAAEARELQELAGRLAAAPRRVAGLLVAEQSPAEGQADGQANGNADGHADGAVRTTLLFQEYAGDGSTLPIKRFAFEGNSVHIESMVLQFQGPFTEGRKALRGCSLPLFLRLRGDKETAETAHPIDEPGRPPAAYRGPEVAVSDFERQLWRELWRLANDEAYRAGTGVRALRGQVAVSRLEMGRLYTLTLNPDASLVVTSEPLKPEVLKMLEQDEQKLVPQKTPATRPVTEPAP